MRLCVWRKIPLRQKAICRSGKRKSNKSKFYGVSPMKTRSTKCKILVAASVLGVIILCITAYYHFGKADGATAESREKLLEAAISGAGSWKIVTELELEGYIISGACSTNNKSTLAVFEPVKNDGYKFVTSTNRDSYEIIIGGLTINGDWYDVAWFHGAQTEYAEITYTAHKQAPAILKYDTTNMDIIYHKAPAKDYTMTVSYYDKQGNKYE